MRDSTIHAYLGEFDSGPLHHAVENHLACCGRCRSAFDRVAQANRRVHAWLAKLAPGADAVPIDMVRARERVFGRIAGPLSFTPITGRGNRAPFVSSLLLQAAIITVVLFTGTVTVVHPNPERITFIAPPAVHKPRAGGGGRASGATAVHPRAFTQSFAPTAQPALTINLAFGESSDVWSVPAGAIGDPMGTWGNGGLPGPGSGPGVGPGNGGEQGIVSVGVGVSKPELILKTEPEYSEEARKAKYSGAVLLSIVVNTDGSPTSIRVVKSLGMGLDEKAIEAVQKWRFKPATSNGKPVRVRAGVEVNFRLL